MKSKGTWGTPVNNIGPSGALIGAREGYAAVPAVKPKGYSGTVNKQFQGSQKGNDEEGISTGTPYQSELGNPNETSNTRQDYRYGVSTVAGGQDLNNPSSNGNGVILDGMNRAKGYQPPDLKIPDSPVPENSPWFDTRTIREENRAHLGANTSTDLVEDDLSRINRGVMNR